MRTKKDIVAMAKNYWKENAIKLIWIGIPLFISLMIWLVSMTYHTSGQVELIKKESESIAKQVENVDKQLTHKLDVDLYNVKHEEVIKDINQLKFKVDRIYDRQTRHYTATQNSYENVLETQQTVGHVDTNVRKVMNKVDFIYKEMGLIPSNDSTYLFTSNWK